LQTFANDIPSEEIPMPTVKRALAAVCTLTLHGLLVCASNAQ
jgi:hypothetical protein